MPPTAGHTSDRRRRQRLRLACRLRLNHPGQAGLHAQTEDISCEGFFFYTDRVLWAGQIVDCEVEISSQIQGVSSEPGMVLCGQAEVVRVVPVANPSRVGVACRFRDYTVGALSSAVPWSGDGSVERSAIL